MTNTPDPSEPRPPLADLLVDGPVRADPPRRSRHVGVWNDKLIPLLDTPNEWFLVEQFSRTNQAENAATNLRRPNANKPPLPEGWHWEFSSASFPSPTGGGHSSLYAKVVAPNVTVEPTAPVVREEREITPIVRKPRTPAPAPEDLARPASSEPDPATLALPEPTLGEVLDGMPAPEEEELNYESLKAENDTTGLDTSSLQEALAVNDDDRFVDDSDTTIDEIAF